MDAVEVEIEAVDGDPDRVVVVEEEDTNLSQQIRDEEEILVEAHSMEEEEEATSEQKKLKAFIAKAKQVFKTRVSGHSDSTIIYCVFARSLSLTFLCRCQKRREMLRKIFPKKKKSYEIFSTKKKQQIFWIC